MKKKKFFGLVVAGVVMASMVGCASNNEEAPTTTQTEASVGTEVSTTIVSVSDAEGNMIDVEFPVDPQRVVVLNWQTLDFLDAVGMGDRVVGLIKGGSYPEHLKKYYDDESIVNVGGMKDVDMEEVMSLQPDVIFSSDRTRSMYDEFSMIAPTMSAYVDYSVPFMEGYKSLAAKHGQIFGVEGEIDAIIAGYEERIAAIAEFAEGKTGLIGLITGGGLHTLGNEGRCNIIMTEMGFTNLAAGENVNHGNISSYEAWLEMNPDYMFVLDKDAAVGEEATAAKELLEVNNPIIAETDAFKNGNIVYLEPGSAWYVADGGITSLDLMIKGIEEGIGLK